MLFQGLNQTCIRYARFPNVSTSTATVPACSATLCKQSPPPPRHTHTPVFYWRGPLYSASWRVIKVCKHLTESTSPKGSLWIEADPKSLEKQRGLGHVTILQPEFRGQTVATELSGRGSSPCPWLLWCPDNPSRGDTSPATSLNPATWLKIPISHFWENSSPLLSAKTCDILFHTG